MIREAKRGSQIATTECQYQFKVLVYTLVQDINFVTFNSMRPIISPLPESPLELFRPPEEHQTRSFQRLVHINAQNF